MEMIWLREALFSGQTANGFKLGTVLSLGWFWSRVAGCRLVYRGGSMGSIDFDVILAVVNVSANEIALGGFVRHEPGQVYFYVVRCANRCGRIERTLAAAVKAAIGADGGLRQAGPNGVFGLAGYVDGGAVELVWTYSPIGQQSRPEQMRVYADGGTGEIDYANPVATATYRGRWFYRYRCELPADGRYLFSVRPADEAGRERESMRRTVVERKAKAVRAIEIAGVERL